MVVVMEDFGGEIGEGILYSIEEEFEEFRFWKTQGKKTMI